MCGRYSLATPDPFDVRGRFPIGESVEVRRRYNVAPGDDVLAVTTDKEGAPRGELLRWGLVPTWAKRPDTGLKMINARVETITEKPAFRRGFERYRCLIIADGFYEWRPRPGATRSPKQPFHITRAGGELFSFAGLWSVWHAQDGSKLRTCTMRPALRAGRDPHRPPRRSDGADRGRARRQRRPVRRARVPGAAGAERPGSAVLAADLSARALTR
jgi:putative SOS response-associated peptidase YedK